MSVYSPRVAFKPFEHPEAEHFKFAMSNTYWTFRKWTFESDVQDFHVRLVPVEKAATERSLLTISQTEVDVKEFWGRVGDQFPKPEFKQVGATFAESEVRHADAYSHLLEILGLNSNFAKLLEVPAIGGRVKYLTDARQPGKLKTQADFVMQLALFSLFTENVSLFAQFAVIKSINKKRGLLKDIDNVIQATQQEENLHAQFGAYLINLVRAEKPEWFDAAFYQRLRDSCLKAFKYESAIVDWIYEGGELPYLSAADLKEFLKDRFNESLGLVGAAPAFAVDAAKLDSIRWFAEELYAPTHTDGFHKKFTTYSRHSKAITADQLF